MKKIKITALLLIAALILALAGCANMNKATDDIGIDLSGAISRAIGTDINTVRVWLVADGTNNFVELDQSEFTISAANSTITLNNIPVGPTYTIYLTLGTLSGDVFTAVQTANGEVSVAGGVDNSLSISASALKTVNPSLTGKNLKAVLQAGGVTYAIDESNLYYGGTTKPAPAGYKFNDLDLGINGDLFLSANADNGQAIVRFDVAGSTLDPSYSAGLPAESSTTSVNILSSTIFNTAEPGADNDFQAIFSQLNAGFIINIYDEAAPSNEWTPIDIEALLSEAGSEAPGLQLSGELIKGIAVVQKGTDTAWFYLATKLGNFRKAVSWAADAVVAEDFGEDFISGSAVLKDRLILNIDHVNRNSVDYLFIGTDNGLYSSKVQTSTDTSLPPITNEAVIPATSGERVELIAAGPTYTACVTALNLIIVSGDKAAKIAFNEGLPSTGLLNGDAGITGLEWKDADTLIVSGSNGLVEIETAPTALTYQ